MKENTSENGVLGDLLRSAIQVVGRIAIPPERVRTIIGEKTKLIRAFNLCDGTLVQKEVIRKAGLNQGSFSETSARWVANGIAFRIGSGKSTRLLHIYPIPETNGSRCRRGARRTKKR